VLKKVHILFAVRDSFVAEQLRREMDDEENCSFHIAKSGHSAYAEAGRILPDILVVDAVLPGMDGLGLVDRMRDTFGSRMPCVIGGFMMPFGERGFLRRGAVCVMRTPWDKEALRSELLLRLEQIEFGIDWEQGIRLHDCICLLLSQMGMSDALKGYDYLAWAAALAYENEGRLFSVGRRLYTPIAEHFSTTPGNVERLIRHAVESMMNTGKAKHVYMHFGNTIDPARGKPTNAQAIAMMAQWLRMSA